MNDRESNGELPTGVPLSDQRAAEVRMAEHCGEDLAQSTGFCQIFQQAKQMPHFNVVRDNWENACVELHYIKFITGRLFYSGLRHQLAHDNDEAGLRLLDRLNPPIRGRPKADADGDFNFLSAWLHCGLWMLSHDDRALCMELLFHRETPLGTDALRKQGKRLSLLGWHDFAQTYQQAPLACSESEGKVVLTIASCWKHLFA
jgi:hypothetical protein